MVLKTSFFIKSVNLVYISYVGVMSNRSSLAKKQKFRSWVLVIHFAQKVNIFHSIKLFLQLGTHVSSNPICLK